MKSFAVGVRDSIVREGALRAGKDCCRASELTGFALGCGSIVLHGGGTVSCAMRTEHAGAVRAMMLRMRAGFGLSPSIRIGSTPRLGGQRLYEIWLESESTRCLMQTLGIDAAAPKIPQAVMARKCCREAFLRGLFLGCGTIADPENSYQLSFVLEANRMAKAVCAFLQTFYEIKMGVSERRGKWVVYTKDSETILGILSLIGAGSAIFEMENTRILREARNRANRASNCDTANIGKMLGAAERQRQAIDKIDRTIGVDALPAPLREIAMERRANPDITLEELGERLSPPASKSGVYHRLRRVEAIARSIDEER